MINMVSCKDCKYFIAQAGICKRFPPIPVYNPDVGLVVSEWSQVDEKDYCGEWSCY